MRLGSPRVSSGDLGSGHSLALRRQGKRNAADKVQFFSQIRKSALYLDKTEKSIIIIYASRDAKGQSVEMLSINRTDCPFVMQVSCGKSGWLIINILID